MTSYDSSIAQRFLQLLAQREAELHSFLRANAEQASKAAGMQSDEVTEFKDLALEQTRAVWDEARVEHAAQELGQLMAAQRRIKNNNYGRCLNCGEPIDLHRLMALPTTLDCTACQDIHYHERPRGRLTRPPEAPGNTPASGTS